MTALWTIDAMATAMGAEKSGALPAGVNGLSIDSRTLERGDAFFAIQGDSRDGHDFVEGALQAGAGVAVVARSQRARFAADAPLLIVDDVLDALRALARAARERISHAKVIAVTGSVGKTGTKEALRLGAFRRRRDPCLSVVLQQSLGRAAVAGALPGERQIRRVRDRHEPCRRDHAAHQTGAAARGDRHHGRAGASGIFRLGRKDRRRQGGDLRRAGARRRRGAQPRQRSI